MNGIIDLSPTREKIRGSARKKLKRPQSILTPLDLSKSLDEALAPLDVEKYKNYIVDEESIQDVPLKVCPLIRACIGFSLPLLLLPA